MHKDQHSGYVLRYDAGQSHTVLRHVADNHEEQIHNHVQNACRQQIHQRTAGVAVGTHDTVAEVENAHGGHSERVNAEVQLGALQQIIACPDQPEHPFRAEDAQPGYDNAGQHAEQQSGMYGFFGVLLPLGAQQLCDADIDPGTHTDQESGEERHEDGSGADRSHGVGDGEFADNGNVCHVEQYLHDL